MINNQTFEKKIETISKKNFHLIFICDQTVCIEMDYAPLVAKYSLNRLAAMSEIPPEKNPNIFNPDYIPVCFQISPEQQKLRDLVRKVAREPGFPEPRKSWYDSLRGDRPVGTRRAKCKEQLQKLFLPPSPDSPSALEILRSHFNEVLTTWGFAKSSPESEPISPIELGPEILPHPEPELNLKDEPGSECDKIEVELEKEKEKEKEEENQVELIEGGIDLGHTFDSFEFFESSVPIIEIVDQKKVSDPVVRKRPGKGKLLARSSAVPEFEDDFWFSGPSTYIEAPDNVEPPVDLMPMETSSAGGERLHSVWDSRLEKNRAEIEPNGADLPDDLSTEESWDFQLGNIELNASPSLGSFIHVDWQDFPDDGECENKGTSRQENVSPWESTSHGNISQPNVECDNVDPIGQSDVPHRSDSGSLSSPQTQAMLLSSSALIPHTSTPETLPEDFLPLKVSKEMDGSRGPKRFKGQFSPQILRLVLLALFRCHIHLGVPPLFYFIKPHVQLLDLVANPSFASQLAKFIKHIKLNKSSHGMELLSLPSFRRLACFYLATCATYQLDLLRAGRFWQHILASYRSQKKWRKLGLDGHKRGKISEAEPKVVELREDSDESLRSCVVSLLPDLTNTETAFEGEDDGSVRSFGSLAEIAANLDEVISVTSNVIDDSKMRENNVSSPSSSASDSSSFSLESESAIANGPNAKLRLVERNLRRRYNVMPFFDEDEVSTAPSISSLSDSISPFTVSPDLNSGIQMLADFFDVDKFRANMNNLTFESPYSARTDYDKFDFVQCRESYLSAAKLVAIYKDGELRDVAMENFKKYSPVVMSAVADAICDLKQYAGETLTLRLVIAAQKIDELRQEGEALTRMLEIYMGANQSRKEKSDSTKDLEENLKEDLEDPQLEEILMRFKIFQAEYFALLDQQKSMEMSQASYLDAYEEYTTEAAELVRHILQTYRDIFTQEIRFIYNDKSARELHEEFGYFSLTEEHEKFIELPLESFKEIYVYVREKIVTPAVDNLGRTLNEIQGRVYDCAGEYLE